MINKRGGKWGILLSLILGLLVLGFFMSLVYQEYFNNDNSNWEVCKESIQLRATLPEARLGEIEIHSFKTSFPLKCKTSVVNIRKKDVVDGNYKKIIASTMAECWHLYGNGDLNAFPEKVFSATSICVPCARIHLTEDAKLYIEKIKIKINIRNSLDEEMFGHKYSYLSYLNNSGKNTPAFNPRGLMPFNLDGKNFNIDVSVAKRVGRVFSHDTKMSKISLPEFFNVNDGDLIVNYGIVVENGYTPYLFYFQSGQNPNPFDEVQHKFYLWSDFTRGATSWQYANFCESWDGIPA